MDKKEREILEERAGEMSKTLITLLGLILTATSIMVYGASQYLSEISNQLSSNIFFNIGLAGATGLLVVSFMNIILGYKTFIRICFRVTKIDKDVRKTGKWFLRVMYLMVIASCSIAAFLYYRGEYKIAFVFFSFFSLFTAMSIISKKIANKNSVKRGVIQIEEGIGFFILAVYLIFFSLLSLMLMKAI